MKQKNYFKSKNNNNSFIQFNNIIINSYKNKRFKSELLNRYIIFSLSDGWNYC